MRAQFKIEYAIAISGDNLPKLSYGSHKSIIMKSQSNFGLRLFQQLPLGLKNRLLQEYSVDFISFVLWFEKNKNSSKKPRNSKSLIFLRCQLRPSHFKYLESLASEIDDIGHHLDIDIVDAIIVSVLTNMPRNLRISPVDTVKEFIRLTREVEQALPKIQDIRKNYQEELLRRAEDRFTKDKDCSLFLKSRNLSGFEALKMSTCSKEMSWSNTSGQNFQSFIEEVLSDYFSPLISYFQGPIHIEFTDSRGERFSLQITCTGLKSHRYEIRRNGKLVDYSPLATYQTPRGVARPLRTFINENKFSIVSASFKRGGVSTSLENYFLTLYANPLALQLVQSFFQHPEFFQFNSTCSNCGLPLSNPISAITSKGPICGDHKYLWQENLALSIGKKIYKSFKSEEIFQVDSPLISLRLRLMNSPSGVRDRFISESLYDLKEPTLDEITSLVLREISAMRNRRYKRGEN